MWFFNGSGGDIQALGNLFVGQLLKPVQNKNFPAPWWKLCQYVLCKFPAFFRSSPAAGDWDSSAWVSTSIVVVYFDRT